MIRKLLILYSQTFPKTLEIIEEFQRPSWNLGDWSSKLNFPTRSFGRNELVRIPRVVCRSFPLLFIIISDCSHHTSLSSLWWATEEIKYEDRSCRSLGMVGENTPTLRGSSQERGASSKAFVGAVRTGSGLGLRKSGSGWISCGRSRKGRLHSWLQAA